VKASDTLAEAAGVTGVSLSSIHRRRRSDKDFARELETARRQAEVADHHASRMVTRSGQAAAALDQDPGETDATQRAGFEALLSRHANDGDSKGCAKALGILAEIHYARLWLDMKADAKRAQLEVDSDASEPLQVRLVTQAPARPAILDISSREPRNDS